MKRYWRRDVPGWSGYVVVRAKGDHEFDKPVGTERGFTLVELLVVFIILPLIVGAISFSLISVLSLQSGASSRVQGAGDTEVVSASFVKDVQSSTDVTIGAASPCTTTGTQELALEWVPATGVVTYVTYDLSSTTNGTTQDYSLVRSTCNVTTAGSPAVETTSATTSTNLTNNQTLNTATPTASPEICELTSGAPACVTTATSWIPSLDVATVQLAVSEPPANSDTGTPYIFTLVGSPRANVSAGLTALPSFAPLTLLSQPQPTCTGSSGPADLTVGTDTTLNLGAAGTGGLADESNCPGSVSIATGTYPGKLNAATLYSGTSAGNSVSPASNGPAETSESGNSSYPWNPLASLLPSVVTTPPSGTPTNSGSTPLCTVPSGGTNNGGHYYFGHYTGTGATWTCQPGVYPDDPFGAFRGGTSYFYQGNDTTTINFEPGNYYFEEGLTVPDGVTANFGSGVYVFDNVNGCGSRIQFETHNTSSACDFYSNYNAFNFNFAFFFFNLFGGDPYTDNNFESLAVDDGATVNANNVLFYVNSGSVYFGQDNDGFGGGYDPNVLNNGITITPMASYNHTSLDGVAIWDAAVPVPTYPGSSTMTNTPVLALGAGSDSYGGIYAPTDQVVDNNPGAVTANFIVANSAKFQSQTASGGDGFFGGFGCNAGYTFFQNFCKYYENLTQLSVSLGP